MGRALVEHCSTSGDEVFSYDHKALDIADAEAVESVIVAKRPDAVINCAAWTDVDGCETNPTKAEQVNSLGPANLARRRTPDYHLNRLRFRRPERRFLHATRSAATDQRLRTIQTRRRAKSAGSPRADDCRTHRIHLRAGRQKLPEQCRDLD